MRSSWWLEFVRRDSKSSYAVGTPLMRSWNTSLNLGCNISSLTQSLEGGGKKQTSAKALEIHQIKKRRGC